MKSTLSLIIASILIVALSSCGNSDQSQQKENTNETATESKPDSYYMESGKTIALATFNAMSKALMSAMEQGGVQAAFGYCNAKASFITDSLSAVYNADIRRTSLQLRNSENKPTEAELKMLNYYQAVFEGKDPMLPTLKTLPDDRKAFYAPIKITKPLCLKCHGVVGEDVSEEDYAYLKQLYPEDKATGFKQGDLRGLWSITFGL